MRSPFLSLSARLGFQLGPGIILPGQAVHPAAAPALQTKPVMVSPPGDDGEVIGAFRAFPQNPIHLPPLSVTVKLNQCLDLGVLLQLQPDLELGDALLVGAVLYEVPELRPPGDGLLLGGLRRVLDISGDPDFPCIVQKIEVSVPPGKVRGRVRSSVCQRPLWVS